MRARIAACTTASEIAASRKPLEMHREQQDEQDGKPEVRHGDANLGQCHGADVAGPVVLRGRINAGDQRQHGSEGHRHQCQWHGQRESLQHQFKHRCAVAVADAKITHQQAAEPLPVTRHGWQIEPQFDGQRLHCLGRSVRSHQDLRRVARQYFQHQENDNRGAKQRGQQGTQTFEKK
jgi:hypothetical protein